MEMTTTGTMARNLPMIPSPQMRGRKAATVVLTLPKTGHMTSCAPRTADVEPLLPADWFDRAWVTAARTWPTGRRPLPRPPRWVAYAAAAVLLAVAGAGGTWLALSSGGDREVLGSVVASTLDGPSVLDDAPPLPEPVIEEAPELFGDVEIGELPTYDLTTRPDAVTGPGPELAPPAG